MTRFAFKLEAVLEQRKNTERQQQRAVAAAQQTMLSLQAEFDALSAVLRSSAVDLRTARLTAAALAAHQRFAFSMRHKASILKENLSMAERKLHDAQVALTEASKHRKVMEKLREREYAKWMDAQRRAESADADEVARQIRHAEHVAQFDARI